ncbi:hypothetical protein GOP47_0010670 [Adiantum capillus-veneris]|uniref:Uncharacterized protein n=2 Tax=Adiantum capillus-veneris TaxID=13818 RepID=A0A9D4ZGM0_ADICA|nr:hypothetical protein GOP47_0010670 [Adiantum capillus-veneris]
MGVHSLSTCGTLRALQQASAIQMKSVMTPGATRTALSWPRPFGHMPSLALRYTPRPLYSPCRAQASSNITFHFDNTAITVPLSQDAAVGLSKAIENVLNTFREKEKAARPRRWETMEFRHTDEGVYVELFCNPNAYANFFQAKVLITVNDEKLKIVTEAQLSAIKAEVEQYVKAKV